MTDKKIVDWTSVKKYPIIRFLRERGILPAKQMPGYWMYRSPFRKESNPSFKVDLRLNLWMDFGMGEGGSAIDLCMRMEGCSFADAVKKLGGERVAYRAYGRRQEEPATPSSRSRIRVEVTSTLPPHLRRYLSVVRGIDLDKAAPFLCCVKYEVNGRRYEAIGFANRRGGYELRDGGCFKGTVAPKDITILFADTPEPYCLFEGFVDFLSYLTMKEQMGHPCIVLNSVGNVARAVDYLQGAGASLLFAFLDNDEAGRKAVEAFRRAGFEVDDMSRHYRDYKDLNEYHVNRLRRMAEQAKQKEGKAMKGKNLRR